MHRTVIAALVVALAACGGEDPDVVPEPDAGTQIDAGTDAGSDAGADAGTDAGTDAGEEPEPEPVRLGLLVVNGTDRRIALHVWAGDSRNDVSTNVVGEEGTVHVPSVAPESQAWTGIEIPVGGWFFPHYDGGRISEVTLAACKNTSNPASTWSTGAAFALGEHVRWSGRGGSWGFGYGVLAPDSRVSAETHALVLRLSYKPPSNDGNVWGCNAVVGVEQI